MELKNLCIGGVAILLILVIISAFSGTGSTSNNDTGLQVKIISDGAWTGSVGTLDNGQRSISGTGTEVIDLANSTLDIGSACIQKQNGDNGELTVQILKNGNVDKEQTTSAPYGVVTVSA